MNYDMYEQACFEPLYYVTQNISFLRKYNHVDLSRYINNYCTFPSDFEETGTMGLKNAYVRWKLAEIGENRLKLARCFVLWGLTCKTCKTKKYPWIK